MIEATHTRAWAARLLRRVARACDTLAAMLRPTPPDRGDTDGSEENHWVRFRIAEDSDRVEGCTRQGPCWTHWPHTDEEGNRIQGAFRGFSYREDDHPN